MGFESRVISARVTKQIVTIFSKHVIIYVTDRSNAVLLIWYCFRLLCV